MCPSYHLMAVSGSHMSTLVLVLHTGHCCADGSFFLANFGFFASLEKILITVVNLEYKIIQKVWHFIYWQRYAIHKDTTSLQA